MNISVLKTLLLPSQITHLSLPRKIIQLSPLLSPVHIILQNKLVQNLYFCRSHCLPLVIALAELHVIIPYITFKASETKRGILFQSGQIKS